MKKKILTIVFIASLALNLVLGSLLIYQNNDKSYYEKSFIREISFVIERFEGFEETSSESEYIVAVAHLYSAYTMLANINEEKQTYKELEDFHYLWNVSAAYPHIIKANLPEIIDVLLLIKADENFDDGDALLKFQEIITEIRNTIEWV